MSVVCVLAPVIICNWPVLSTAVIGAVTAMGFSTVKDANKTIVKAKSRCRGVEINVDNSEIVTETMTLDQRLVFQKENITVEFFRDARSRCGVKVYGESQSEKQLQKIGQEVSQRVVQHYIYNKLLTELKGKDYHVVEEGVEEDNTIKLKIRRWGT